MASLHYHYEPKSHAPEGTQDAAADASAHAETVANEILRPPAPSEFVTEPADLAKQFADLYSEYLEPPWDFWYFSFLTFFGGYTAGLVTLESSLVLQPRLYTSLLGVTGDARKTTAMNQTRQFFADLAHPSLQVGCHVLSGVGSAEGLGKTLAKEPKCILHYDELKSFVGVAKRDGSVLLPVVNSLFETNTYQNTTKTADINVENGLLSLLSGSTVETYVDMFTADFMSIGFPNRVWIVPAVRTKSISRPKPIDPVRRERLLEATRQRLRDLHALFVKNGLKPHPFGVSPDADRLWDEWYQARARTLFDTRLDTYGLRLQVLLSATRGYFAVGQSVVEDVIKMLAWQLEARRDYNPIDAETLAARTEDRIRRVLTRGPQTERMLFKLVNARRVGHTVFRKAIDALKLGGEIELDSPTRQYRLVRTSGGVTSGVTG